MSFLTTYLPSLLAALMAVLSIFSGQIQSVIAAHPSIAAALAAVYAIIAHILPSPVAPSTPSTPSK
jgi:hypothetical protein